MKKIFIFILCFFVSTANVFAETITVKFSDCVDGDTAKFIYKKNEIKVRFLGIDTPETKHPTKGVEPFGKEASNYTCDKLKNAKTIKLEYDKNSDKKDKYGRHLVWVFVDGTLLQKELIEKGYAKTAYLYGKYKYNVELKEEEKIAKEKKIGIWSNKETTNYTQSIFYKNGKPNYFTIGISIIIIIILYFTSNKFRKRINNKIKKKIKSSSV